MADVDLDRAERVAHPLGYRATADPLALIDDAEVKAILVASHDSTHAEFLLAGVNAGKPVLCEKPLAPTLAESAELIRAVGQRAELVSVGFMRRFDPGYADLKAQIHSGSIGRPLRVHSVGRGVSTGPGWTDELSITSSAIRDLDIVPWLLESPVVEATWLAGRSAVGDFHNPLLILLRTADGTLSTVDIFLNAQYGYDMRCEVVCDAGMAGIVEPVRQHHGDHRRGPTPDRHCLPWRTDHLRLGRPGLAGLAGRTEDPAAAIKRPCVEVRSYRAPRVPAAARFLGLRPGCSIRQAVR